MVFRIGLMLSFSFFLGYALGSGMLSAFFVVSDDEGVVDTVSVHDAFDGYVLVSYEADSECGRVVVFTDPTCPYCRRLHRHIDELNARGISVDYVVFSRRGPHSRTGERARRLYCEDDRRGALEDMFGGLYEGVQECGFDNRGIYRLADEFGIVGTPAIVLEDGLVVYGGQNIFCEEDNDRKTGA